jgi:hypothetical protein
MSYLLQALDELDDLVAMLRQALLPYRRGETEQQGDAMSLGGYATTRLRPPCLASYSRTSARFSSRSADASAR